MNEGNNTCKMSPYIFELVREIRTQINQNMREIMMNK